MDQYAAKRAALKEIANDESKPMEERFKARLKLAKLPRNSFFHPSSQPLPADGASARLLPEAQDVSRIALSATLAQAGQVPGMVKSSW